MYLPKSKYRNIVVLPGQYTLNGEEYVGEATIDYKGKVYAGKSPSNNKGILEPVLKVESEKQPAVPIKRVPTEEEYKSGRMVRYFRQDLRTKKIDEIYESEPESSYTYATASWELQEINVQINQRTLDRLDLELPGFKSSGIIPNSLQFVR